MKKSILFATVILIATLVLWGEVPLMMNYQGILKDENGEVVEDGTYELNFAIYAVESGGHGYEYWMETQNVSINNGVFQVLLGSVNEIVHFPSNDAWLSVKIGDNPEMTPRKRIASVGYSFIAKHSETSDSANNATTAEDANNLQGHPATDFLLDSDYVEPFAITLNPTTFNITNSNVWYEIRELTVTVDSPMSLRAYGHFAYYGGGTLADNLRIQIILKNQQGTIIDYGTKSFRSGAISASNSVTEIIFNVSPGTYIIVLNANCSITGNLENVYIELMALPQANRQLYSSEVPSSDQIPRPYTDGPLEKSN